MPNYNSRVQDKEPMVVGEVFDINKYTLKGELVFHFPLFCLVKHFTWFIYITTQK